MPIPDFVNNFNKQQHVKPTTVKNSDDAQQAIDDSLDMANKLEAWSLSIKTITEEISDTEFCPYYGEWNQGTELAAGIMLKKWDDLNKNLQQTITAYDLLVMKYVKCVQDMQGSGVVVNLAELHD